MNALEQTVRTIVARVLGERPAPTAWGTVTTVGPPTTVTLAGDTVAQAFTVAAGVTVAAGDTVGLVRFGSRLYVTEVIG